MTDQATAPPVGEPAETQEARRLLDAFVQRTGVRGERPPRRYLWTDAYAVCTLLELARRGSRGDPLGDARRLVRQVHEVLGRHRPDDPRTGWISGLPEAEGRAHPTAGGLRIGKRLPERPPDAPFDERLEWDRDGQYFHYLTRWMHALSRISVATGEREPLLWAIELAATAVRAFTRAPGAPRGGLAWKLSIDLSRTLVGAMGLHDPLDGALTLRGLLGMARLHGVADAEELREPLAELHAMCAGKDWTTSDPLGLGGLLADAYRSAWLDALEGEQLGELTATLLQAAARGLGAYLRRGELARPADERLAFRELGLAIGLSALPRLRTLAAERHGPRRGVVERSLAVLAPYADLAPSLNEFWSETLHQQGDAWREHEDIDTVMLAASLLPDGLLRP